MAESLILSQPGGALVFGMDWFPLVGARPLKQGRRVARRHRATHVVYAGEPAVAVGVIALPRSKMSGAKPLFSAGQNVARMYPNATFMMLLELDRGGHWLLAVHGGAVVARTDSVFRTPDEAAFMVDELRLAYPHIVLLGEPGSPMPPTLAAIEAASSSHSRLRRMARWPSVLPWPIQVFVLALVLTLLLPRLWTALQRPTPAQPAARPVDAAQAWQQAVAISAQQRVLHESRGYAGLLEALYRVPVMMGGWALSRAECLPGGSQWQCHALYGRRHAGASNDTLMSHLPEGWRVEFISMEQARAVWNVAESNAPLLGRLLKAAADNDRQWLSQLQALSAAFSRVSVGPSVPLALVPPTDREGKPIARPAGQPVYVSRTFQLTGPLRSGSLLTPLAASMSWTRVKLSLHDTAVPSLKSSRLVLTLEGVLYEIDVPPTGPASRDAPELAAVGAPAGAQP
jgi:hypothetical protein